MSKPAGADWRQRAVFSGDKWFHCYGAQGIFGPDGIFYDWFDGPVGRHADAHFMTQSGVNETLRNTQLPAENRQFWIYLDKGYVWNTHCRTAARMPGLTPRQIYFNWVMSKVREGVEWGFGRVKSRNSFILRKELLKLQSVNVARYVRVAVFLTNCDTCIERSCQTSLYFMCHPPTLEEYLM